jgi:hypothetical protein
MSWIASVQDGCRASRFTAYPTNGSPLSLARWRGECSVADREKPLCVAARRPGSVGLLGELSAVFIQEIRANTIFVAQGTLR